MRSPQSTKKHTLERAIQPRGISPTQRHGREPRWNGKAIAKINDTPNAPMPRTLSPQLAVLAKHPPQGDEWVHEIKFDGYRIIAFIKGGTVSLITRNGHDWTHKFPAISHSFEQLKVESAIVDGEIVVLDEHGRSDFQALQAMLKGKEKTRPIFYAFDLAYCNGVNLMELPLLDRKSRLEQLFQKSDLAPEIAYSRHFRVSGDEMLAKACDLSLEGIISKRVDAPYTSRRDGSWVKSKCGQSQELVVIGFTEGQGKRSGFGALLLGYYDDQKRLVYAGRVGTGFDESQLLDLHHQLKRLEISAPPTANSPTARQRRAAHWVSPKLVAIIQFTGWTRGGLLRHPVFISLRSDKPASQVVREKPMSPAQIKSKSKRARKSVYRKSRARPQTRESARTSVSALPA